jgi:hypothetical protein
MAKGGKREGAGRKRAPHTIQAEAAKKRLVAMFVAVQEPIFEALLGKALTADIPAIKELFERVWGKVPATIDPGDNDMEVFQFVIKRRE